MLALNGLAWLAIGLGAALALSLGTNLCLLIILCRYGPPFHQERSWPKMVGYDPGFPAGTKP